MFNNTYVNVKQIIHFVQLIRTVTILPQSIALRVIGCKVAERERKRGMEGPNLLSQLCHLGAKRDLELAAV